MDVYMNAYTKGYIIESRFCSYWNNICDFIIPNKNSKFKDHFKIIHITNFKALYILYIFIYFN
ncbi:hypothetical protein PFNF54_05694 [Plasmodium falciparum NF54]|uniref:Uncharacterized protein n=1 Tax=Plasmodium falciparum (isolate NF54) TaxID=5843 RepID=W7JXT0_PLAFO|nr:hypothetical protein PFNF54_05694 [Plasmodium falciparum NF54]